MKLIDKVKALPDGPGVYLMLDKDGAIIYIGKAISLKKRVSSYFGASVKGQRTKLMVSLIDDIEFITTSTEAEALILESGLIKENRPKFNIDIKDDKAYPLLRLSTNEKFACLRIVRRRKNDKAQYFGPYTSGILLRQALNFMRRLFPLRTCNIMPKSVCLNYHLKICPGPCQELASKDEYDENVFNLLLFLKGKKKDLIKKLSQEMKAASLTHDFESALELRNQIESLSSVPIIYRRFAVADQVEELQKVLRLKRRPVYIEGYDISNIFGSEAVGSMVRFKGGRAYKRDYRRFKIKSIKGVDDYAMMREVLFRRFSGEISDAFVHPDLILIDGGKGHLKCAAEQLKSLKINIPIISLAKKFEHIYVQWQFKPISLPLNSKALRLVVAVRDEAHRFALNYHRNLRKKKMLVSELDLIPGVGKKRRQILRKEIEQIDLLKGLTIKQLKKIKGIDAGTAKNIIEHWKKY
ncbi:MAG: excinuclease ABC subunit UvrC [Candidatus Omnitrophica bacterium]|nr:excinuclease ABC subunit UvrC [Candidatus Omnitrophota bacterium]